MKILYVGPVTDYVRTQSHNNFKLILKYPPITNETITVDDLDENYKI